MDTGRKYDLEHLRREYSNADAIQRRQIKEAAQKITNETGMVKSMRERLLKEHRKGSVENIKDVHDYISKKNKHG